MTGMFAHAASNVQTHAHVLGALIATCYIAMLAADWATPSARSKGPSSGARTPVSRSASSVRRTRSRRFASRPSAAGRLTDEEELDADSDQINPPAKLGKQQSMAANHAILLAREARLSNFGEGLPRTQTASSQRSAELAASQSEWAPAQPLRRARTSLTGTPLACLYACC